jgi:hypothetical protein
MGRYIKRFNVISSGLIAALLLVVLIVQPVLAADPPTPTNLQFESAKAYRHLIEADDFLVVFHYNIHYDTGQPDDPANELFTFRLLDTNGEDYLAAVVPYVYYNSGYDQGIGAFYFPADEAPDWDKAYVIRISGNPEHFSSPPVASRTLVNSDYSQMETPAENQTLLGNYILDVARKLEINWDTSLLYVGDLGTVLNSTGETYFRGAITGLQAMAPQIFAVQTTTPQYEATEWTQAESTAWETRFEDTWIGKSLVYAGDQFHIKWNFITGLMILAVVIALAVWCQMKYGTTKPVMIGGTLIMLGGTVMGWVAPALMAIVTIFFALFLGYIWMFRTS